jgi:DNA-binding IclR family transcriptional regulator
MTNTDVEAGVRAVELAAAILKTLAASPLSPERGVRDLARELGVGKSTVHRITSSLVRTGLLMFNPSTQKYALGPAVLDLASAFQETNDLVSLARPSMEWLRREIDETVALHVLEGGVRVTLFQVESTQELRVTLRVGHTTVPHAGAAGRVLMAALPRDVREQYLAEPLGQASPRTLTDPVRLRDELDTVERDGYALRPGEIFAGILCLAAPILTNAYALGAIGVYAPEQRLQPERVDEVLPKLREACRRVAADWSARNGTHRLRV